jgi:hypothetical protein
MSCKRNVGGLNVVPRPRAGQVEDVEWGLERHRRLGARLSVEVTEPRWVESYLAQDRDGE